MIRARRVQGEMQCSWVLISLKARESIIDMLTSPQQFLKNITELGGGRIEVWGLLNCDQRKQD